MVNKTYNLIIEWLFHIDMKTTKILTTVVVILGIVLVLSMGATAIITNTPKAFATTEQFERHSQAIRKFHLWTPKQLA